MAALLRSQDAYDPIKNIREWQSQQLNVQPSDYVALFKEIVLTLPKITHIPRDARTSLERSCSALILWSDGYGIAQGRLNATFKKSRKLRRTVLQNLLHIGRVLIERLVPLANISTEKLRVLCSSVESSVEETSGMISEESCRESDESSSDAGSAFSNDDIYEIAEDLKTDTRVLSGLDSLLKFPIFDLNHEDSAESYTLSTWSPEKLFSDKIENRFPCAEAGLALHLGKTNYERYLRCQANRDALGNEETVNATNQEGQEHAGTIIAGSKFHDSGIGTSIALTMSYAETLMSYSHDGQSVRIPPLSKEAKAGLPFSCLACGRTVLITNNSAWKRHIYLDLQPYMCLDMSCPYSSTTFESRDKWISHLALDHEMDPGWDSAKCLLCNEETGSGKMAVTRHLSKHLEEISLSALPVEVDSNAASENSSEPSDSDSITQDLTEQKNKTSANEGSRDLGVRRMSSIFDPEDIPAIHSSLSNAESETPLRQNSEDPDETLLQNALDYLRTVKAQFADEPGKYETFLETIKGLKNEKVSTTQAIFQIAELCSCNPVVIKGFNDFLPPGYRMEAIDASRTRVFTPQGEPVIILDRAWEQGKAARLEVFSSTEEIRSDDRILHHAQGESDPKAGEPFPLSAELTEELRQRQQQTAQKWAQQFLNTQDDQIRQKNPQMQDLLQEMARTGRAGQEMMDGNGSDRPSTFASIGEDRRRSAAPSPGQSPSFPFFVDPFTTLPPLELELHPDNTPMQVQIQAQEKWTQQFLNTQGAQVRQMDLPMQDLIQQMAETGQAGKQMMNGNDNDVSSTFVSVEQDRRQSPSPLLPSSSSHNRPLTSSDVMYSELKNYNHVPDNIAGRFPLGREVESGLGEMTAVTEEGIETSIFETDTEMRGVGSVLQQLQNDEPMQGQSQAHDRGGRMAENQQTSSVQNDQAPQEPISPQNQASEKMKLLTSLSLDLHPITGERPLTYMMLLDQVQSRGGYRSVTDAGGWDDVSRALGLPAHISIVTPRLKHLYEQNLLRMDGIRSTRRPSWRQEKQSPDTSMPPAPPVISSPTIEREVFTMSGIKPMTDVYSSEMEKRKEKEKSYRRHEPARAYQFGNRIIVEDEDGEVVKTYELPPQDPTDQESTGIKEGLKKIGLGHFHQLKKSAESAAEEGKAGKSSAAGAAATDHGITQERQQSPTPFLPAEPLITNNPVMGTSMSYADGQSSHTSGARQTSAVATATSSSVANSKDDLGPNVWASTHGEAVEAYRGVTKVRKPDGQHNGAFSNRTCTWADSVVQETGTGASGSKDRSDAGGMMRENDENDERRYCYCNNVSYGEMIACDADDCPREWFHLKCAGLDVPLRSSVKWYCKDCRARGKGNTDHDSDVWDLQADHSEDISGNYYLE
ncbi:ankyrin repeat [Trichoderma arundinaceum]|uniref:Ankyrin repeat n=1 Tax=Trichoderma arundinaceum TaxID=490622 RepID=A0A395NRB3_TRIAR|nr:ankyrin repeat [Trichoderma arundinaceum]